MESIKKAILFSNIETHKLCHKDRVILLKEAKLHLINMKALYKERKEVWLIKLIKSINIKKREIENDILKYQFPC